MNEPTRFGDFLLLKKLSEDPLGEVYRAGRAEGDGVGEIVFLRTFSLPGAKTAELAAALHDFESCQKVQGPGLTYPVGGGEVGGVAYVIYDYATGWDLLRVVEAATSSFSEIGRDHLLLIAERIAKGLAVLHQATAPGARPFHGFLVPHNVRVTGEGEIELLGLEVSPYLARLAAEGKVKGVEGYLSPEVRSGAKPAAVDDVYSLGAILWHLLVGRPPSADAAARSAALASARLSGGEDLPAGLAEFLESSLARPGERPAHAGLWHRQLSEWMAGNEIKTTHFDLAFSIHELFRRQIQAEEDEIAAEKKLDLSPAPADGAEMSDVILRPDLSGMVQRPAATPVATPASGTAVRAPQPRRAKGPLVAALAVVALLAVVVAGWYLVGRGSPPAPPPVQAAPVVPPPAEPEPAPAAAGELDVAELELERLVRERARTVGDQIAAEYDEQIRSLREQLEEARTAEAEALRVAAENAEPAPTPAAAAGTPPPAAPEPVTTQTPPPAEPEPEATPPPPAAAVPEPETAPPPEPASAPAEKSPPPAATSSAPTAAPAAPRVEPPVRLRMPAPSYPARARQYRKEATVIIKVLVDAEGKVTEAQPVLDKPDTYGFQQAAIQAARAAVFKPGTTDGEPTEMWTTVVVTFKQ